jgi:biopolymer transport protein ExbB
MTGLGIAVAIPAVVFYNLAVRINRRIMYQANDRAHDLLADSASVTTALNSDMTLSSNPEPATGDSLDKVSVNTTSNSIKTKIYKDASTSHSQ